MNLTKRSNGKAVEQTNSDHADRSNRDEPGFHVVVTLDESQLAQVSGGATMDCFLKID